VERRARMPPHPKRPGRARQTVPRARRPPSLRRAEDDSYNPSALDPFRVDDNEEAAMNRCSRVRCFVEMAGAIAVAALASVAGGSPALAATFVYVSNADDGDISTFTLKPDG